MLIGIYLLRLSPSGWPVFATGRNADAVQLSGVNTRQVKVWTFMRSSISAALAGMMLAARSGTRDPSMGAKLELDVITAVISGMIGFGLLVMVFSPNVQEVIKSGITLAVSVNRR